MITFRKTKEKYGGLSNMASGYGFNLQGINFLTSEALYQAMRYPNHPEIQKAIIIQKSPMTAKMMSKKYKEHTRSDWELIRIMVMRWCIRIKLIKNWDRFGSLLLETSDKVIVEESRKDDFWGAKSSDQNLLVGTNALGRLLMELRSELPNFIGDNILTPPKIENLKILGKSIQVVNFNNIELPKQQISKLDQYENLSLFDNERNNK